MDDNSSFIIYNLSLPDGFLTMGALLTHAGTSCRIQWSPDFPLLPPLGGQGADPAGPPRDDGKSTMTYCHKTNGAPTWSLTLDSCNHLVLDSWSLTLCQRHCLRCKIHASTNAPGMPMRQHGGPFSLPPDVHAHAMHICIHITAGQHGGPFFVSPLTNQSVPMHAGLCHATSFAERMMPIPKLPTRPCTG